VGGDNARKVSKKLQCHISSLQFPHGSFIQAKEGLVVSSPELCFVQMAGELSLVELIALGYELCGSYRLDSASEQQRGFRGDVALSSVSKLGAYVSRATGLKGRKNAQRALRFIADGSASPMETVLVMLLCLPYLLGGYGFPLPLLNCPVEVQNKTKGARGKSRFYCDLYWGDEQVDVEYDSDAYNVKSEQIAQDAIRRNTLSSAGVAVVTVTRRQIVDMVKFREVARALSKLLDKRLQCPVPEFGVRHAWLRGQILPSAL
jgi:hypothetical protein